MVHRSGSTHQYDELFTNEESNPKAKDDLQINEALKNSTNTTSSSSSSGGGIGGSGSSTGCQKAAINQLDENDTKRPLRTSKRLCSINPDVMTPPKSIETTTTNTTSSSSSSSSSSNNNTSSSNSNNCSTSNSSSSNNSSKTSTTDPLITAFNLIPIATIKPTKIRNRRYTINDCVQRPSERCNIGSSSSSSSSNCSNVVPFANQKSKQLLKISSTTDELYIATGKSTTKSCASGKSLDDFNIKKDHFNCSVSLERLTGIVDSISMKLPLSLGDNDDATGVNKVLCLYCDRTFSSLKLYAKHVERVHQSKSGRRVSARTTISNATATNYPGCSYCNVGKVTCLESEELTLLVRHLIQQHGDKYFACEECLIRFQTRDQLVKHASVVHGYNNDAKTKKESQQKRKTSRNVQSHTSSSSISSASSSSSSSTSSSFLISSSGATAVTPLTVQVDFDSADTSDQTNLRNRLRRSTDLKAKSERSTRKQLLTSEETFLSRLGIGLNRSPRSRKGAKNRRGCSSELFETTRSTRSNKNTKQLIPNTYDSSESTSKQISSKAEPIGYAFDEDFYESVCQNVKLNLSCHLDGKLDSGPMSPSPLSPVANVPAVRSILVKSPLVTESEIHEATTISAFTAFPTLLTAQQHGGESLTPGKMKKPITKNSWKWKWDCVKKYKYVNEGGKIVKKIKQSTCGMRDLSTLDMWTQLTMRMRHEVATRQESESTGDDNIMRIGEAARAEKRKLIDQLNKILDTRILPKINVEQNDQSIIKQEAIDELRSVSDRTVTSIAMTTIPANLIIQRPLFDSQRDPEFPALMNLIKRERSDPTESPVILSGEWARPRCYICFGCGSLFSTIRLLEEHKAIKHPFVHSTHYEIVGKELIDGNLFRNFYIPSLALQRHTEYNKKQFFNSICSAEDSMDSMTSTSLSLTKSDSFDLDSNSRNSKVSVSSVASISDRSYSASADDENANSSSERTQGVNKICSKCNRQCKGTLDLYRHMLDCSSDYAWILAKKRNNIKYRYFGTKRRRPQRSRSSSGRKIARPKKERRNSDTSASPKSKEPSTPRQRPSDAESIQRMLANLPAKRAARQIFPNLTQKPNNKNKMLLPNRTKILLKQKMTKANARGFKVVSTSSTTINSVGTNLALRKRRSVETANSVVRRTRSSINVTTPAEKSNKSNKTNERRKSPENASSSSSSLTSATASSSSSSSTGKKANEPTNKNINDLGRVFRRRTKAVVTKITNTFRRGQKQRLLRTTTHHSPNTSKNTNSTKLDTNKLKTKKTFLRTLSFRRSNRNTKNMNTKQSAETAENKSKTSSQQPELGKSETNPDPSSNPNPLISDGGEKKILKKSQNEDEKFDKNTPETTLMCNANKTENSPTNPIESTNPKAETLENATDTAKECEDVSKTLEAPRLKRKRSIKTIINEMRAKCQNQTTETSQTPNASDLSSTDEKLKKDDTHQQQQQQQQHQSQVIPVIEIKQPIDPLPEKVESQISIAHSATHVTMPLSLTIEPLDEPLNLCISPQKNLSAANSSLKDADGKATSSTLQPPEPHLENISPRRRTRKLNDCIAMLTGKLQEKLGVPFIDQTSALLPILSPGSEQKRSLIEDNRPEGEKLPTDMHKTNETPVGESQNRKETEKPISEKESKAKSTVKDTVGQKIVETSNADTTNTKIENQILELNTNKRNIAKISVAEKDLANTAGKAEIISNEVANEDPVPDAKQLRPRKTRDSMLILTKESENNKALQQTNKTDTAVPVVALVEDKNEKEKDLVQNELKEKTVQGKSVVSIGLDSDKSKKNFRESPQLKMTKKKQDETKIPSITDNKKQTSIKETADNVQSTAHELSTKNLDDSESTRIETPIPTSQYKSKKKASKQNIIPETDNVPIELSVRNFMPPKDIAVEQLSKQSNIKSIEMDVIDIEDEIKLNIVHKEMPVAVKQTAVKKVVPTERKSRSERPKTKGIEKSKSGERSKAESAPTVDPLPVASVIPLASVVPTVTEEASDKTPVLPSEIEPEEANAAEIPTSRTMRSRKQTNVEPTALEPQLPDKKKAEKVTKPKESKSTKKASSTKEDPIKEQPISETLEKETPVRDTPVEEMSVIEPPPKEKPPKVLPVKEAPVVDPPPKEKPTKISPVKETLVKEATVKAAPVIGSPHKEKPSKVSPVKETLVKETAVKQAPVTRSPSKEKPLKVLPVKEMPIRGAKRSRAVAKSTSNLNQTQEVVDIKPPNEDEKCKDSMAKESLEAVSEVKITAEEKHTEESPVKEQAVVEKSTSKKKSTKSSPKRASDTKSKSRSKATTPKKSEKKVDEAEESKPTNTIDRESSKLQTKPIDQVESKTSKTDELLVETKEKSLENLPTNQKQSEKPVPGDDKNIKQKSKKVKNAEKTVKSAKSNKLPKKTVDFDNSDDELLPWDPEKGFIQATTTTTENTSNTVETASSSSIVATPVDMPSTGETQETEKETVKSAPKPKKKRMSELAQIIADQLLESFKEVDQSRVDELKKIQDLSHSQSEAELISTSLSTTPIPKRKSKKLFETVEPKVSTKTDKTPSKQKKDVRKKAVEPTEEIVTPPPLDSKSTEKPKEEQEDLKKAENVDDAANLITTKSKKEKKSSKKKSSKKEAKKKKTNKDTASADKTPSNDSKQMIDEQNLQKSPNTEDIKNNSSLTSSVSNAETDVNVDKTVEKSPATKSPAISTSQTTEKIPNLQISSAADDMVSADCGEKAKTSSIFTEVLLSQKNPRTERLSDIIGLADKEALSRVPSIKNVVFPQWQSSIDKPTIMAAEKEKNVPIQKETKLNFWSRSSPSSAASDKSDRSKIFGVVKNKARDLFSKISKKKLKKSIKTSIRSSSSSSSSSSCSSASSSNAPKKPLLRPSILSCNNFRDTVTTTNVAEAPPATMDDIFESLRDTNRHDHKAITLPKRDVNVSPSKLDTRRSNKKEKTKNTIDTNPKSLIESDMNIAKIALALEKSQNRKEQQQNLNKTSHTVDKIVSPVEKPMKKSNITEAEQKTVATTIPTTVESTKATSLFLPALQNDDSQDTIISQIVNKIREKADRNDSDDELCLSDVAKGLPKNADIELPISSTKPLNQVNNNIENETSALGPNVCKNTDRIDVKDINCDDKTGTKPTTKDASDDDDDDGDANTEMIDMDLEDNESVYTTFSQSTSITSGGGGGGRKKRRKKSILSSGRKSSRRSKERKFASPNVSYHCDICNKSFRNQHGLNNHKATITHISKLSEQEFLNAKEKQNENKSVDEPNTGEQTKISTTSKEQKIVANEKRSMVESNVVPVKIVVPPETHDNIQSSVIRSSPVKINSANCSPYVSPNHMISSNAIEPISSPEQSSRFNGTPKTASSLTPSSVNARLTLSQEERLFYECCSMLKGSDRPTVGLAMPELTTKPVTPKCTEQPANIAQAAQSPRSHSSPRPGLPKLDINQFSDISSDSNPAYSCPQVPSSSKTQKVFSLERSSPTKRSANGREKDATPHIYGARQTHDNPDASSASGKIATRCSSGSSYPHSSAIVRNYPDSYSDMGDSFPSSQDASESENYAQTILERTNHFPDTTLKMTHNTPQKGEGSHYMQASLPHENIDFRSVSNRSHLDSPLHSTSSQSSSLSRPRTKAALKGYENLKVSIPTTGLDLQHALERSPNSNGCKLAALADIALGNDVPFNLIESRPSAVTTEKPSPRSSRSPQKTIVKSPVRTSPAKSPSKSSTLFTMSSDSTKPHSIELKSKSFEATFHVSPKSRKRTQSIGKKTGYKDRKKKNRTTGKPNSVKLSPKISNTTKPKDVYDFEESHDSVEDEIIPLAHTRSNKVELNLSIESKSSETAKKQTCDDQEDESSYSDRDDYYNFNSVSGSGTEDQDVPAEDDEISDRETTQSSKSTKQGNDSQKKCLIMGRIFKNAKKNSETASVESGSSSSNNKEKSVTKPIPKNELDEIFDNLKNKNSDAEKQQRSSQQQRKQHKLPSLPPTPTPIDERPKTPKIKIERNDSSIPNSTNDEQSESIRQKSRKPREVANLEAEWGMSVEQIKGIIGVGMRKAQRRCTANRQNKLVETWSSDEYEEFHSTKDIIALIQEAEMKAQRAKARSAKLQNDAKNAAAASGGNSGGNGDDKKENTDADAKTSSDAKKDKQKDKDGHRKVKIESNESEKTAVDNDIKLIATDNVKSKVKKPASEKFHSEDESDFDEHWNKKAKRAKIRNRRRTITSREDLIEKKIKNKSKEKLSRKQEPITKQKQPLQNASSEVGEKKKHHSAVKEVENTTTTSTKSNSKSMKDGKPMPRRKRMASEMLYYWSSSSDEEFGRIEADSDNEDEDNSENHLEQHGWIVGDSHKKLVTLLAHAKGKKIEDCGVKESVHKRK